MGCCSTCPTNTRRRLLRSAFGCCALVVTICNNNTAISRRPNIHGNCLSSALSCTLGATWAVLSPKVAVGQIISRLRARRAHNIARWDTVAHRPSPPSPTAQRPPSTAAPAAHCPLQRPPPTTHCSINSPPICCGRMYHRWCRLTMPPHPECPSCVCFRCHFRRQNAAFWNSLSHQVF